ncbi:DUF6449 domain-containing protein [Jeotgalibacillus sp. R-1-5s-1]|uniref:DUF6449 domain-containing protein n=1 Tax=Jeotgalibacillus sp. R-1-5s-1 TaxID=2555897 RepID=UPI00106B3B60|nr:DUF6449 domain-containing protein [Jeotgalibacillus sp. R-1-5s-1]TFD96270.1 hypothetical protein E2491_11150 [Jeotgalibacillus sp. R-1-5s-1]
MKSGILSLNKGLFRQQARSVTWIGVFFSLALIIMLPLSILIRELTMEPYTNTDWIYYTSELNPIFEFSYPFQLIAFCFFPVLLGIILLNFTTKKSATDFMHSLPFTRQVILTNTYTAGALTLLAPILLTGVLLSILRIFLDQKFFTFFEIVKWMGLSSLIVLFMFIVTMAVGIFVGNGLIHGALTYTVIVVPALLLLLILVNLQYYVTGLALNTYTEQILTNGIFFGRLIDLYNDPLNVIEYLIYTAIASVLVAISYIAYSKRPSEATDQTIVFPFFRSLFLYGLTLFAMLLAGFYFTEIQQGSFVWTIVGYVLGAFIAYTVLQMILQKTLRLSWPWKGFVAYAIAVTLLIVPVNFVAGFYENAVPEVNEVESVSVNNSYNNYSGYVGEITDPETIQLVTELHNALIGTDYNRYGSWSDVTFEYELKDGSTLSREYSVDDEFLAEVSEELRNNQAFKEANDPIYAVNPDTLTYVSIYNYAVSGETRIADKERISEFIDVMKRDLEQIPSSTLLGYQSGAQIGELNFYTADDETSFYYYLTEDYTETLNWMRENDYADMLLLPENFDSVTLVKQPDNSDYMTDVDEVVYGQIRTLDQLEGERIEITTPGEIEQLFKAGSIQSYDQYIMFVETPNGYTFYSFNDDTLPEFAREQFQ